LNEGEQTVNMKKVIITLSLIILVSVILFAQTKTPALKASIDRGKKVYDISCIACHLPDGAGVAGINPPLIKTDYVQGDRIRLIKIVLKGLEGPIEVDGEEYNNAMPAQAHLSDQQIADVLTYVRNSFGNKATQVTLPQVKAVRATIQ
jgi:mono/diheme cytochrome c family protein